MGPWRSTSGAVRVLLVVLSEAPEPTGAAARKMEGEVQALGERAIGRMAPLTPGPSASTATGICPWLSVDSLSQATGITFRWADATSDTACTYTSSDQRTGVLVGLNDATDLDSAWNDAKKTFHLPDQPTSLHVGGLPAYAAILNDTSAAVAVDLAGTPDGNGKVLGLLVAGFPSSAGDPVALAARLAETALAAR